MWFYVISLNKRYSHIMPLHFIFRYIKKLQEAVKGKAPKKGDDETTVNEYQIKIIALKTTSNISTLIRDLFHNPPIFRSVVQLSWITKKSNVSYIKQISIFISFR